ncbi:hypothetical protein AOL_s00075g178 [Orbilia oligospora ATCC 24927]|uniref:Uncharacterized protein n=2 Tax=Orbilia oligospora TaxID=2813651 RepID=G1X8H9_ARTOA|nr:hypothetical protein AOL_s00075g178 [Orbilia oligospora ATCC 24927]EGX50542.1 hypothetical protein AOL_s00075g178 [Orbilia oligospora ATCC 24927]KAF3281899.1 hypothetical protein TWF970_001852 [Orbilia oligospora]
MHLDATSEKESTGVNWVRVKKEGYCEVIPGRGHDVALREQIIQLLWSRSWSWDYKNSKKDTHLKGIPEGSAGMQKADGKGRRKRYKETQRKPTKEDKKLRNGLNKVKKLGG